tara:strand:- start:13112 stop:14026 length:915 start_codon:yes stop_codon:yes gene_type:complete
MKLYVYPNAKKHVHDDTKIYYNTVPLSEQGIRDHCTIVSPEEADYFYMGQIPNDQYQNFKKSDFEYFDGNEDKHICDIEGEGGMQIPNWLHNCIITTMGPLKIYSDIKYLFARPTFSHLLLDIIDNQNEQYEFPRKKSFGFRGYLNHIVRAMMVHALHHSDLDKNLHINRTWSGPSEIGSKVQKDYIDTMLQSSISLCPRGSGIDSVRLLESCYYNRVPILISDYDYFLVGEDTYDTSFVYRICKEDNSPEYIKECLQEINNIPHKLLEQRAEKAKRYFDDVIREYFKDPTEYFLKWLKNKNEN